MSIYNYVKENENVKLKVVKEILMGDGYISVDENDENYFMKDNMLYVRKDIVVSARIAPNNWLEITFKDGDFIDVAFDEDEDYDLHFEVVK